jgi:hypothetical protein
VMASLRLAEREASTDEAMTAKPAEPEPFFEPDPENNAAPGLIPPDPDDPSGDAENMEPQHGDPEVDEEA